MCVFRKEIREEDIGESGVSGPLVCSEMKIKVACMLLTLCGVRPVFMLFPRFFLINEFPPCYPLFSFSSKQFQSEARESHFLKSLEMNQFLFTRRIPV